MAALTVLPLAIFAGSAAVAAQGTDGRPSPEHLVFTTDDAPQYFWEGCDSISVLDVRSGNRVATGQYQMSPGRLAATSDGSLVVAASNNNERFLSVVAQRDEGGAWKRWQISTRLAFGAALGISPDDRWLLLPQTGGTTALHDAADLRLGRIGTPHRTVSTGTPAEVLFASDSSAAYVVSGSGMITRINLSDNGDPALGPILFQPARIQKDLQHRNTHAALSPDSDYIVVGTGARGMQVVDLTTGNVQNVDAPGLTKVYGVRFEYTRRDRLRLAAHGHSAVAVYEFNGRGALRLLAKTMVPAQRPPELVSRSGWSRIGTLAWSGGGDAIIAAIGGGALEFRVLDLESGQPVRLTRRLDFDSCTTYDTFHFQQQFDVLTLNDRLRPPPTPTPPPTSVPTATATTTPPPTTPASPTATQTPTPTFSATPTDTPILKPLYLPLAVRERCAPDNMTADVALVIDASTSMRDGRTQAGRTKLDAAVEAAQGFVDTMSLPRDQAAVVVFNEEARVLHGLTGRRADVIQALSEIPQHVHQQTRIDLGIQAGHLELMGTNRHPLNRPVMIVLTDGLANPVPASVAVRKALDARGDGITIFTIGLGQDHELNVPELREMASKPEYYYHAPDGEDLLAIYDEIAGEIPCPAEAFWGGR